MLLAISRVDGSVRVFDVLAVLKGAVASVAFGCQVQTDVGVESVALLDWHFLWIF